METFQVGVEAMPDNALYFVLGAAVLTIAVKTLEVVLPEDKVRFLPSVMPLSIGFYSFPNYAIDALIGACIRIWWMRKDKDSFERNYAVVAAGMVGGEGITSLVVTMIKAFSGVNGIFNVAFDTIPS